MKSFFNRLMRFKIVLILSVMPQFIYAHGKDAHCAAPKCPIEESALKEIEKNYSTNGVKGILSRTCSSCHDTSFGGPYDENGTKHFDITSFPITGHHGKSFIEVLCHLKTSIEGGIEKDGKISKMPKKDPEYFTRNPAEKSVIIGWINESVKAMNSPENQNCEESVKVNAKAVKKHGKHKKVDEGLK